MRLARVRNLILLAAASQAHSQLPRPAPVHWSVGPVEPAKGVERIQVILHAAIDPGWHLYALQAADAFPLATEIALQKEDPAELLRVQQGKPHHAVDPESRVVTNYFVDSATFTLQLRPTTRQAAQEVHILVRYQACNDRLCLPPRNEIIPVQLYVTR